MLQKSIKKRSETEKPDYFNFKNFKTMKKIAIIVNATLLVVFILSCNSNSKLTQDNAEKGIKNFITSNKLVQIGYVNGFYGEVGSFDIQKIEKIEQINQYSEREASIVVHFKDKQCIVDNNNLSLKFNFKLNH